MQNRIKELRIGFELAHAVAKTLKTTIDGLFIFENK